MPPELLLFKTIGIVLVLLDEKGFVVDVLTVLFIFVVAANSASSFSSE